MKILAVYTTKTGTVERCLDELKKNLPRADIVRANITSRACEYDIADFDVILIGSSIRMGKIHKNIKKYIEDNKAGLLQHKVALFLCLGFPELFDEYVINNFPRELRDSAIGISCFGGEMDLSRQKGIDKILMKIVRNEIMGGGNNGQPREDMTLPTINEGNISQLAEIIKSS